MEGTGQLYYYMYNYNCDKIKCSEIGYSMR